MDGADGARTRDLLAASQTLSQLSYGPSMVVQSSREPEVVRPVDSTRLTLNWEKNPPGRATLKPRKGNQHPLSPLDQARRIAGLAEEKLAQDIVILDMRPVCAYTDFFVVCSGQNPRQTKAIVDEVRYGLKHGQERLLPHAVEGERQGDWIVADYLDVVYGLEELWDDVPSIEHATAS